MSLVSLFRCLQPRVSLQKTNALRWWWWWRWWRRWWWGGWRMCVRVCVCRECDPSCFFKWTPIPVNGKTRLYLERLMSQVVVGEAYNSVRLCMCVYVCVTAWLKTATALGSLETKTTGLKYWGWVSEPGSFWHYLSLWLSHWMGVDGNEVQRCVLQQMSFKEVYTLLLVMHFGFYICH